MASISLGRQDLPVFATLSFGTPVFVRSFDPASRINGIFSPSGVRDALGRRPLYPDDPVNPV